MLTNEDVGVGIADWQFRRTIASGRPGHCGLGCRYGALIDFCQFWRSVTHVHTYSPDLVTRWNYGRGAGPYFQVLRKQDRCPGPELSNSGGKHVRPAGPERVGQDLQHPHDDRHHHAGLWHRDAVRQTLRAREPEARRVSARGARPLQEDEGDGATHLHWQAAGP